MNENAIKATKAVPLSDLPDCVLSAMKKNCKVVTYCCTCCGVLMQFEAAKPGGYRKQLVECDCGNHQFVHLF